MKNNIEELKKARDKLQESINLIQPICGSRTLYGFSDTMKSLNAEIGRNTK